MLELPLLVTLFQEVAIRFFYAREAGKKKWLVNEGKKRNQRPNFLPATCLWSAGQIAPNDGFLMEDAELNWHGME